MLVSMNETGNKIERAKNRESAITVQVNDIKEIHDIKR